VSISIVISIVGRNVYYSVLVDVEGDAVDGYPDLYGGTPVVGVS
jgi:hypothetical protein